MPRTDADRCCYCDRPLARQSRAGVCKRCEQQHRCCVCQSPVYPDEPAGCCPDCRRVSEMVAAAHAFGRYDVTLTAAQEAVVDVRIDALATLAAGRRPLFGAA